MSILRAPTAQATTGLRIHHRDEWADGLEPRGPMPSERPGNVRFLLIHHTGTTNDYSRDGVPQQLRGFYLYHTASKGWNDIAYNFLVDRYGGVWEGRAGSLQGPVRGDATGGSQGFDQLACFIGDHQTTAPTAAAQASMVLLLAHLATRYGVATGPAVTTTVTSRGSTRFAKGTQITTHTIAGHRDVSLTTCPGDAAYALIPSWRRRVHQLAPLTVRTVATQAAQTTVAVSTSPSEPPVATASAATASAAATTRPSSGSPPAVPDSALVRRPAKGTDHEVLTGIAAAGVAALVGVVTLARRARSRGPG